MKDAISTATSSAKIDAFGQMPDGRPVSRCTLARAGGLHMAITNFGGAIASLWAPDRSGAARDVVLGYESLDGYLGGKSFFGGIIGRFGNRIAGGRFAIGGTEYALAKNNGPNHLHGGPGGFDRVLWEIASADETTLKLVRMSPDGDEGYPGNLRVEVTYSLPAATELRIDYRATTDRPTPVNLTNHSYFNLAGHDAEDILDHELQIRAARFTPVDAALIPTGELRAAAGTPFDFRETHRLGERIEADDEQLRYGSGYDHNFVLDRNSDRELELAARVHEPKSGRVLEVLTSEPGIQFYSGNFLTGAEIGKGGVAYRHRTGFCLETQHFPDSPNQPAFPNTILRPGEVYESSTVYRFTAV